MSAETLAENQAESPSKILSSVSESESDDSRSLKKKSAFIY